MEKFVRDHLDWLHEEGIGILASSVTVSLRVLETLSANKVDAVQGVVRAFGSSLHVVKIAAKLARVDKAAAQDDELDWQDEAIKLVSSATDRGMQRCFSVLQRIRRSGGRRM